MNSQDTELPFMKLWTCYNDGMNDKSAFKENFIWFIAVLAVVIGAVSLIMTLLSRQLESKSESQPTTSSQFWIDQEEISVVNVLAAGAVMPMGMEEDGSTVFADIEKTVRNYEVAALSSHALVGTDLTSAFADRFYSTGFTMCGLAYPEVFSEGRDAVDKAIDYWVDSKLRISGINASTDARNQLRITEVSGITAAYLSFTDGLTDPLPENEKYLVNLYEDEKTPAFVSKAAELADIVVVSICWDGADGELPTERQKQIANDLADAGASVIIGYSENAVQPVAWIDDTLVFYSLGNLVSQDDSVRERIGALGSVTITKTVRGSQKRVELTNPKVDLIVSVPSSEEENGSGWKTVFLRTAGSLAEDSRALYDSYTETLHRMDDSIRIGGLG